MDSWAAHATPNIKFENSPVESVLSTPDGIYSSLFSPPSSTMDPHDIMSPHSFDGSECDLVMRAMSAVPETPADAPSTPSASADKKPTKKRKSWGQVLPEPKTNLPPRKRAKTEDEKEQRRVERVLRNRRAAQSSRERKRQEVENLEKRNKDLESALRKLQQDNTLLLQQLQKAKQDGGVSSALTFSQPLFSSQDAQDMLPSIDLDQLLNSPSTNTTVNPASLSPAMTPVPEEDDESDADDEPATVSAPLLDGAAPQNASASPDSAQHPAVMLSSDLQCRSAEASPSRWLAQSQKPVSYPALALLLPLHFLLTSTLTAASLCQRPLTQIAISMRANFSLPPTRQILTTIIWLVTTPRTTSRPSSTSTTTSSRPPMPPTTAASPSPSQQPTTSSSPSSTTSSDAQSPTRPSSTLRLKSLRKILTCSPSLARPLSDATLEVLRLVSSERPSVVRVLGGGDDAATSDDDVAKQGRYREWLEPWLSNGVAALPSKEVLLSLLWVIKVEEQRIKTRAQNKIKTSSTTKLGDRSRVATLASTDAFTTTTTTITTTTNTNTMDNNGIRAAAKRKRGLERSCYTKSGSVKRTCFE